MYSYADERHKLFTEDGQVTFLKVRDAAQKLLKTAGAFRQAEVLSGVCGDSWLQMACLDRLVELGEIVELPRECWAQYKVYTTLKAHDY